MLIITFIRDYNYGSFDIHVLQVCTTDLRCFCTDGWAGGDCSERSNITIIPLLISTTEVALTTLVHDDEYINVTDNATTTSSSTLQAIVPPKGLLREL